MAIIDKIQLSGTVYTIGNETTTAVTSASTDNEIPTAKAVYDAIPQGGGGKAIEAGRGISITTGETADTVSFNLPISAGTGTNALIYNSTINSASGNYSHAEGYIARAEGYASHAEGESTKSKGYSSHAEGTETEANGDYSHSEGHYTITTNESEHSSGKYNNSVSASTTFGDSGNTLFSVGNGYRSLSVKHRHNALEIRQNGDIYIANTNDTSITGDKAYSLYPMIKLQDAIGGGGSSYTAGDGIDITNDVISVTGKVDTSAITTTITSSSTDAQVPSAKAVNDKLGRLSLVKLTQSEYDSLTTKDNSTLYIIVN